MIKRRKFRKEDELFLKIIAFQIPFVYLLNYLNINEFDVFHNFFHAKVKNLINIKQILSFVI